VDSLSTRDRKRASSSELERLGDVLFAPFRDAWLAGRARFALLATLGAEVGHVAVESYRGNIVLTGDVATRALSEAAESAARAVPGVVGVSNRLHVQQCRTMNATTDAETRAAVTARLRHARALRASAIVVESVYDGVVRLTGAARDAETSAVAFALAVDVPGVRRVINDVVLQSDEGLTSADAA